jgi:hypothetical protein
MYVTRYLYNCRISVSSINVTVLLHNDTWSVLLPTLKIGKINSSALSGSGLGDDGAASAAMGGDAIGTTASVEKVADVDPAAIEAAIAIKDGTSPAGAVATVDVMELVAVTRDGDLPAPSYYGVDSPYFRPDQSLSSSNSGSGGAVPARPVVVVPPLFDSIHWHHGSPTLPIWRGRVNVSNATIGK